MASLLSFRVCLTYLYSYVVIDPIWVSHKLQDLGEGQRGPKPRDKISGEFGPRSALS